MVPRETRCNREKGTLEKSIFLKEVSYPGEKECGTGRRLPEERTAQQPNGKKDKRKEFQNCGWKRLNNLEKGKRSGGVLIRGGGEAKLPRAAERSCR